MRGKSIESILGVDHADQEEEEDVEADASAPRSEIEDAQASHTTKVANMVYAVEYDTGERFNKFFEASL